MPRIPRVHVVVIIAAIGSWPTQVDAATPRVSITDLGTLPGDDRSVAGAINDRGQIVGYSYDLETGEYHPVLWQHGAIVRLTGLDFAYGINDRGQIVGQRTTEKAGELRTDVVAWQGGAITELETLPGSFYSFASSINGRGDVAGYSVTGSMEDAQFHAVAWNAGAITELRTLPGAGYCIATAINAGGDIAGWCQFGAGDQERSDAVVWQNGRITALASFPDSATGASPTAMNNRAQFVGIADVSGSIHAVRWQSGTIADLGTLLGDTTSVANDISDRGQIVGASFLAFPDLPQAVLWSGGDIVELGPLPGDDWSHAIAINNSGQIVGISGDHAVVWETVPSKTRKQSGFSGRFARPITRP